MLSESKIEKAEGAIAEMFFAKNLEENPNYVRERAGQQRQLMQTECIDSEIGEYLELGSVSYIIDMLGMDDETFQNVHHSDLSFTERKELLDRLLVHLEQCPHCQLKRKIDEANEMIDEKIFDSNKKEMAQIYKEVIG